MRNDDIDVAAIDDGFFAALCKADGIDPAVALAQYDRARPASACSTCRSAPARSATATASSPTGSRSRRSEAEPHGIDLGPMVPRLREMLSTPSGKIELAPPYITADLDRLRGAPRPRRRRACVLVSRRHLRSNNSWMHNVKVLVKGKDRCTLLVHPDDATAPASRTASSRTSAPRSGTVEVPVEVSDEMMPGVVSLPHGWGHDKAGTRLSVAREHAGVNNNLLAPGDFVDEISNNAAVNGIPVEVVPA